MPTRRREPQRTCIGCREVGGKRGFVRIVRTAEGRIVVETRERLNGRGAYLHRQRACWEQALGGGTIGHALRMSPDADDLAGLQRYLETILADGAEEA